MSEPTAKELQALYDEYEKLDGIYEGVKAELVEDAIEEAEATDSFAASREAYRVFNEARKVRIIARNHQIYYGKKK
jgi:hypothetical protein